MRAIALTLATLLATPAIAADVPTISIQATGTVAVEPDIATIQLTVLREGETAREALSANSIAMSQVLSQMEEEGIAKRDLQTSNFNLQPRYSQRPRIKTSEPFVPEIIGYTVFNSLTVRVRDLSKLGIILDKAVTLGVNSGGGISFGSSKPEEALAEARAIAMKNAIAKAETLTGAAGARLGRILTISEQGRRPQMARMRAAKMELASDAMPVPVAAGEGSYAVNVNVTWEIAQ
ncbi:MAG: SIMPL domain-containing protein [Pseudomonadota bacterium]